MSRYGGIDLHAHTRVAYPRPADNPTTTLINKSFYFNRIQHFYVKHFDSFYRLNPLKFKCLENPCISNTYLQ
jgi:hypothetical protein